MANEKEIDPNDVTDEEIKEFFLGALQPLFTPEKVAKIWEEKRDYYEKHGDFFNKIEYKDTE